jgi:U3 small nucleolar RNA-associated protein 12
VTGSADHDVKFWEFELVVDEASAAGAASRRLSCAHVKTLKMTDDALW